MHDARPATHERIGHIREGARQGGGEAWERDGRELAALAGEVRVHEADDRALGGVGVACVEGGEGCKDVLWGLGGRLVDEGLLVRV